MHKTLLLAIVVSFCVVSLNDATALDFRQRKALENFEERPIFATVYYHSEKFDDLINEIPQSATDFRFIETLFLQKVPASKVLKLADNKAVRDVEIIDDTIAKYVYNMLLQIFRLHLYHRIGVFRFGVLNISIGAPTYISADRTGQRTIHRAYSTVVEGLNIPLVTTAGNGGPMPGVFNPWSDTRGVIVAAAATKDGNSIGDFSGRPIRYDSSSKFHYFSAHGIDTIGARHAGTLKSKQMLEAEKRIGLASIVGRENLEFYRVDSGTSYAAASITRNLCFAHQMTHLLLAYADSQQGNSVNIPPFIRAYIDESIDVSHPDFQNRLADKRRKFSGMRLSLDRTRKELYFLTMTRSAIDVRIEFSNSLAVRFLKAVAKEVPNTSPEDSGHGFVSSAAAEEFIREFRYSSLIDLFDEPNEQRAENWLKVIANIGDPQLFSVQESEDIASYCTYHDLVLALPLL